MADGLTPNEMGWSLNIDIPLTGQVDSVSEQGIRFAIFPPDIYDQVDLNILSCTVNGSEVSGVSYYSISNSGSMTDMTSDPKFTVGKTEDGGAYGARFRVDAGLSADEYNEMNLKVEGSVKYPYGYSLDIRGNIFAAIMNTIGPEIPSEEEQPLDEDQYRVYLPMDGYYTSQDAIDRTDRYNRKMVVQAGVWYIFNTVKDASGNVIAIALSKRRGENYGGGWINVADNEANAGKNNTTALSDEDVDPPKTDTTSGYYSEVQTADFAKVSGAVALQMPPNTTCYIINLVTGTRIHFHLPESVSDSISANFDPIDIRGRTNALQGFNTTGPRTLSFDFDLHRDFCEYGVVTTAAQLKALCYPGYTGYIDAPKAYIHLGNAIRGLFIVNDVSVTYNVPYMDDMYMTAQVSMSITEAGDTVYSAAQIEEGYGMTK